MFKRYATAAAVTVLSATMAFGADGQQPAKRRPATRPSAATTQEAVVPYPLKTCIVSGEELGGDMGDPYVFNYQGREIKLCCKSCLKKFNKDPQKYLSKLDEQAKKQKDGAAGEKKQD